MKSLEVKYSPHMPEHPTISFKTTKTTGHDGAEGGEVCLIMDTDAWMFVVIDEKVVKTNSISISMAGTWETEGMAISLMKLGQQLGLMNTVMEADSEWPYGQIEAKVNY